MLRQILTLLPFLISTNAQAITTYTCLNSIISDSDFNNNSHHPDKYFFATDKLQPNQFFLSQEKNSFLCQTDSQLVADSLIDILTVIPDLKTPRRLYYSLGASSREKPQGKSSTVPTENGFLPAHITMPSAIEWPNSPTNKKNAARCTKIDDEKLQSKYLTQVAENEILDLYADFADQRDAFACNYDMKEKDKIKTRKEFDLKLKKILELCSVVPELKSVSAAVSRKINLKSDVRITISNGTVSTAPEKNDKLRSGANQ